MMAMRAAMLALLAAVLLGFAAAQTYPVLNITQGQLLPELPELQPDADGWVTLEMAPATLMVRLRYWLCNAVGVKGGATDKLCA